MSSPSQIPNDANGDALRRMIQNGDDLSKPRMIDFYHIFPERRQALAFAGVIDEPGFDVCISYYEQKSMWAVVIKFYMVPVHQEITAFESVLALQAELMGGKADGWGCMTVKA